MTALEALLVVQEHDTAISQLRHRRKVMPERDALQEVIGRSQALAAEMADVAGRRDEVGARLAELEQTIARCEARIDEIDTRMYSGEVTASRDLQAMAAEIGSIKQRVSKLEDAALEAMEEREPLDQQVGGLASRGAELAATAESLRAAVAANEEAIDAEIAAEVQARAEAAGNVPPELLANYDVLRGRMGGIGAARLEHGTCMGCRMRLPATELDRLKREPPDAIVYCDQCGRILIR